MTDFNGGKIWSWHFRKFVDAADDWTGTATADFFDGLGGSDTIHGGRGSDHIWAGTGDDHIFGGMGNDTIMPYNRFTSGKGTHWGHDVVEGGHNNDLIAYTNTSDSVELWGDDSNGFTSGNDRIFSGSGDDKIYGGWGNDEIEGGAGGDVIYGDNPFGNATGNDTIHGDAGADMIFAGGGNDTITGGIDGDDIWGGGGRDKFIVESGDSSSRYGDNDVIHDFNAKSGGMVWDTIDLNNHVRMPDATLAGTTQNFNTIHINTNASGAFDWEDKFAQAKSAAAADMTNHSEHRYEFVTDGHDGWLFANIDGLPRIDTAIELRGVTDLSHLNLV